MFELDLYSIHQGGLSTSLCRARSGMRETPPDLFRGLHEKPHDIMLLLSTN